MRLFRNAILLLSTFLIFNTYTAFAFESSAGSNESATIIRSLSEIRQDSPDFVKEDTEFLERAMEMRLGNPDKPFNPDTMTAVPQDSSQTNAPKLFRSFNGIPTSGTEPPDPNIAVGPGRIVAVVNRTVAIFSKVGQKTFQTSLRSFFGALPDSDSVAILYPKVAYDSINGHFILVFEGVRTPDKKSFYFLAVSKTNNPEGAWAFTELNMGLNGTAPSGLFADYPAIGFDQSAIYLTGNMATFNFHFQYAKIRILKKSEVYKFKKVTWHDLIKINDATGAKAISIQPAQSFGSASSEFLVSSEATGGSTITLYNIANATSPSPSISMKGINVTEYEPPPDAQQKGGPARVGTGDASLANAVFRNGVVTTAHTISKTVGSGAVSAIRFYEIKTDGSIAQEVTYAAGGKFYSFPAAMMDSRGNAVVTFNVSSGGQFIGVAYTGRKANAARNTLEPSAILKAGKSYYHFTARQTQLWGAYNGIALDYDDSIWMIGAFAKKTDEWDTFIGKVFY